MDMRAVFFFVSIYSVLLLVWFLWLDHISSGEFSRKIKGGDVMIASLAWWMFLGHFDQEYLLSGILAIFVIVRGGQYFWYAGFLRNVRRKRVERLRRRWRQRLDCLEHYKNDMAKEGREYSQREARVMFQSLKQEVNLSWKLEHIIP